MWSQAAQFSFSRQRLLQHLTCRTARRRWLPVSSLPSSLSSGCLSIAEKYHYKNSGFFSHLPQQSYFSTLASAATATSSQSTSSSGSSLMQSQLSSPRAIRRADYRRPDYTIHDVDMRIQLALEETLVTTRSQVRRNHPAGNTPDLVFDGENLELLEVAVNGTPLSPDEYDVSKASLNIFHKVLCDMKSFEVKTVVRINPRENLELSGLYVSSLGLLCTQCEAMGFRRITYHMDRPDVLSRYRVYMEASKNDFPTMLCNGNLIEMDSVAGDDSRHYAIWEDPFPKPSYLFGLVAGQLSSIHDDFTTRSGKNVRLGIYSVPSVSVETKMLHALKSLRLAMEWDEKVFNLECDLDTYNVVAVEDFNMGAMENKGLNIFNSAYVLADPKTATDADFGNVVTVIGHEYFHNWTGNRITLRDWFQLTLKEGLTVFRDQWFTADVAKGHALHRIESVKALYNSQFVEDAGPMSHPIRPESYIAMDNFYTSTVYLKGAEVVRMIATLLGEEGFLRGMELYISRHDGSAVTCDDFLIAMKDANPDSNALDHFDRWYEQPGTPLVRVEKEEFCKEKNEYSITLRQSNKPPARGDNKAPLPLTIPLRTSLYDRQTGDVLTTSVLVLNEAEKTFRFSGITAEGGVVASTLQDFSAPVRLAFPQQSMGDMLFLMQNEVDLFSKWEYHQRISMSIILDMAAASHSNTIQNIALPTEYETVLRSVIASIPTAAPHCFGALAEVISIPAMATLLQNSKGGEKSISFNGIRNARRHFLHLVSTSAEAELTSAYEYLQPAEPGSGSYSPEEAGRRSLRNKCLGYLTSRRFPSDAEGVLAATKRSIDICVDQFYGSLESCMTDAVGALSSLLSIQHPSAKPYHAEALHRFLENAKGDPLVTNKWFAIQAGVDANETFDNVKSLKEHSLFSMRNPNAVRALIGSFAANVNHFHHDSGRGYDFLASAVLELDDINPQIAARMVQPLTQFEYQDEKQRTMMYNALQSISKSPKLSSDTYEIVDKSLKYYMKQFDATSS